MGNMLRTYYENLKGKKEKNAFLSEVQDKCRVNYPTVRAWIAKPESSTHRNPLSVYRPILARITGIKETKLFIQ